MWVLLTYRTVLLIKLFSIFVLLILSFVPDLCFSDTIEQYPGFHNYIHVCLYIFLIWTGVMPMIIYIVLLIFLHFQLRESIFKDEILSFFFFFFIWGGGSYFFVGDGVCGNILQTAETISLPLKKLTIFL